MKILTISVAAYNAAPTIEKCLDSIVNSKYIDSLEIIVVNDGSKDATFEIAHGYEALYPDSVTVVDKENGGHGSTINTSVRLATGKYFKIVDSDDWVETENLDRLVEFLSKSEIDLVVNHYFECPPDNSKKLLVNASDCDLDYNVPIKFDDIALDFGSPNMHKLTFNTTLVKKMGPVIDEHCFYVDIEYVGFLIALTETVCFLDYPVYNYLLGYEEQSVSATSMVKRRDQHKTVVYRMFDFYNNLDVSETKNEFLRRFIASLTGRQYKIYLYMLDEEGKSELKEFDKAVPEWVFKSPGMGKRMLPIAKVMRIGGCSGYITLKKVLKMRKVI